MILDHSTSAFIFIIARVETKYDCWDNFLWCWSTGCLEMSQIQGIIITDDSRNFILPPGLETGDSLQQDYSHQFRDNRDWSLGQQQIETLLRSWSGENISSRNNNISFLVSSFGHFESFEGRCIIYFHISKSFNYDISIQVMFATEKFR